MRKCVYVLFIGLLILILSCSKKTEEEAEPKDVVDLVPFDNEISGWAKSSAMSIAENENQLWDLINGEGQVYIDNGFVKCAFQSYTGDISGPVELDLRIFDMGDTLNAETVYDEVALGSEIPWTGDNAGQEARYRLETGIITNYYVLDFWDANFYTWIQINDDDDAALDVAKLFALNISQEIRAE
jgi:hypothetical protein